MVKTPNAVILFKFRGGSVDVEVLNREHKPLRGRILNARGDTLLGSKIDLENTAVDAIAFTRAEGVHTCSGAVIPFGAGKEAGC